MEEKGKLQPQSVESTRILGETSEGMRITKMKKISTHK